MGSLSYRHGNCRLYYISAGVLLKVGDLSFRADVSGRNLRKKIDSSVLKVQRGANKGNVSGSLLNDGSFSVLTDNACLRRRLLIINVCLARDTQILLVANLL